MIRTILLFFYDWRTPEQKITEGIQKQVADEEKKNTFRFRRSHSIIPRYDEAGKKWVTVKRNY